MSKQKTLKEYVKKIVFYLDKNHFKGSQVQHTSVLLTRVDRTERDV